MPAKLRVYYLGNWDGKRAAMVAAPNQKEACRLLRTSPHLFRVYGGQQTDDSRLVAVATSDPGRVWTRPIYARDPTPWVFADPHQPPNRDPIIVTEDDGDPD